MKKPVTQRQKELLCIIYEYIKHTGFPPTFEDMREGLGVKSNQSVLDLLNKLEDARYIKRNESAARGLSILPIGYTMLGQPPLTAFLGTTTAGVPAEAIEITGDWQEVPSTAYDQLSRLREEVFLLKVRGDSMINAGINDGAVVLVKEEQYFVSGEVVFAHIGDESTIKRFMSVDVPPYTYLKPENPKYKNILFTDDVLLKGKVISVLSHGEWRPVT